MHNVLLVPVNLITALRDSMVAVISLYYFVRESRTSGSI